MEERHLKDRNFPCNLISVSHLDRHHGSTYIGRTAEVKASHVNTRPCITSGIGLAYAQSHHRASEDV